MEKIIFTSPPENFSPKMEAAACYCRVKDKFLFLKNSDNKEYANIWGVPGGKIEPDETPIDGAIREMFEETGVLLKTPCITPFKSVYMRYPKCDFIFHMFKVVMLDFPAKIKLRAKEHKQAAWLGLEEILELPLIPGEKDCLLSVVGSGEK